MGVIGELFLRVRPDTSAFAADAERSIGGALGGLAKTAGMAAAAIGSAMVGAGGFGLRVAADMQQAQIGFTTLLGSAEQADAFIREMRDFAARTPFEFAGLQEAASRLIAVGVEADRVIPLMTALGDATSAMGTGSQGIEQAVRALTQMQQKGKVSGEEMLQLAEAGIPAWDALAAKLGVDVATAQDMVAKGQVRVNDLMAALAERAGPAMQKVAGMMDAQSKSLAGLMSTLKDTLSIGLADAMAPVVAQLTSGGLLERISGQLTSLLSSIGPALASTVAGVVQVLGAVLPSLTPVLESLGGVIADLLGRVAPIIAAVLPHVAEFARLFLDAFGTVAAAVMPAIAALLEGLSPLLPVIGDLVSRIAGALAPVLAELAMALAEAAVPIVEALLPILPQLLDALLPLIDAAADLVVAIAPLLPAITRLVSEGLSVLLPLIVPIVERVGEWAALLVESLVPAIETVVGWIAEFLAALTGGDWERAGEMLSGLWQSLLDGLAWVRDELPGKLAELLGSLAVWVYSAALPWLVNRGVEVAGAILGWFGETLLQLPGKLAELQAAIAAWVFDLAGRLIGWAASLVPALIGWVSDAASQLPGRLLEVAVRLRDFIAALPGELRRWAGNAADWLRDLGGDVLRGLWEGIKSALGNVAGWMGDVRDAFVGGLKNAFGIRSPSTVMRSIGRSIGDGFRVGVEESMPSDLTPLIPAVPLAADMAARRSQSIVFAGPVQFGGDARSAVDELDWWLRVKMRVA
jgi:tape measure domain-containing protein